MSYDLFFTCRASEPPARERFERYFAERMHYSMQGGQAWYENPDTGVYFSFEISDPEEQDEVDSWASFNMNFYRPHYFALEALPELEAFVSTFHLEVDDPQIDGMGQGAFDPSLFASGWSRGNHSAYAAAIDAGAQPPTTLPTASLEAIWRWNSTREERQQRLGESIFVPKITFLRTEAVPSTATVWTDAIPALLPRTDLVLLYREQTAPRRLLRRRPDLTQATWQELEPLLAGFPMSGDPLPHYTLGYESAPAQLLSFFTSRAALAEQPEGLSPDQVLNRELFAARS